MANILDFGRALEKKAVLETANLNQLLKRASLICKEKLEFPLDKFKVVEARRIKSIFESRIAREIFNRGLISSDILLCGIYVTNLLADLVTSSPESWWAIDYALSDESLVVKKGADMCFIICGIFPERGDYREMNLPYYRKAGASCYSKFSGLTKSPIGYHMSQQFNVMADVVQGCMQDFKKGNTNA
jgi:hypothetical protein